ncbi:unnamed protein product [Nippostrongylus brasiliensis]|uniref:Uncharacterized protein n=1 Tax=Nippostrongylus brasiliensis TaxID=27835 RepID=A0A0N4XUU1_NIPBR|nr:unnamed protein product [Nippostrongylus brasiliensis]
MNSIARRGVDEFFANQTTQVFDDVKCTGIQANFPVADFWSGLLAKEFTKLVCHVAGRKNVSGLIQVRRKRMPNMQNVADQHCRVVVILGE